MWKYSEDKLRRIEIFKDTQAFCKENELLSASIKASKQATKFYTSNEYPMLKAMDKQCSISVTGERSFESATRLASENPGKKVAVLNFASAVNPGGGVVYGAGAQEECLCRASTLYPLLNTVELKKLYYSPNKEEGNSLHTDAVIYTPNVVICKTDTAFPERLPESQFCTVDILTCAAPNLNEKNTRKYSGDGAMTSRISLNEQYSIHHQRCKHILSIAADNGVDILVLGAFGCGAFKNDPTTVARAMHDACNEYKEYFDIINFAVVKKGNRTNENYRVFSIEFATEKGLQ